MVKGGLGGARQQDPSCGQQMALFTSLEKHSGDLPLQIGYIGMPQPPEAFPPTGPVAVRPIRVGFISDDGHKPE